MLGKRFFVFGVISHKTREIIEFAMTENPTREFSSRSRGPVKQKEWTVPSARAQF
jgi:hypothetical protein